MAAFLLVACGGGPAPDAADAPDPSDWDAVLAEADGQTVNWYMFGGSDPINAFVTGIVADRAAELGVTLNQVPVGDTVEAVNRVLGEVQAGRSDDGTVDLIWVNGENFLTGREADLWLCDWAEQLPNAELVDFDDPVVSLDFCVPVDGCESAWQRAQFAFLYDSARVDDPPGSIEELFAYAQDNPGRVTYPAPPDFTGVGVRAPRVLRVRRRPRAGRGLRRGRLRRAHGAAVGAHGRRCAVAVARGHDLPAVRDRAGRPLRVRAGRLHHEPQPGRGPTGGCSTARCPRPCAPSCWTTAPSAT